MSLKIAAESWPKLPSDTAEKPLEEEVVVVREYDEERHKVAVEKMESLCEVGQKGKPSLVTDLMGDPICRIRHFPVHIMLVSSTQNSKISILLFSLKLSLYQITWTRLEIKLK